MLNFQIYINSRSLDAVLARSLSDSRTFPKHSPFSAKVSDRGHIALLPATNAGKSFRYRIERTLRGANTYIPGLSFPKEFFGRGGVYKHHLVGSASGITTPSSTGAALDFVECLGNHYADMFPVAIAVQIPTKFYDFWLINRAQGDQFRVTADMTKPVCSLTMIGESIREYLIPRPN